ncbi:MAG: alpha/beta fold hydrolase, partial [Odoribacteraceae bacterium]|nr:alpha/beta fold hydrolase [Odoribacteraceae bacterium]
MQDNHPLDLFFREKGEGSPLVILHGLWGASENWLPVANRLSDRFRVVLPDLRNHGRSPHADDMTLETLAEEIREFIKTRSFPVPPALVGHSLGGKIAMILRLTTPALLSKLIVVDIAPGAYPPSPLDEHARLLTLMERLDLAPLATRSALRIALAAHIPSEEDQQLVLKNIRESTRGYEWKVNLSAIRAHLDALRDFPRHLPPAPPGDDILFIKGNRSGYIPGPASLLPYFPAARLVQ